MLPGDLCNLFDCNAFGETFDGVVAAMHLHQHGGALVDGVFVVSRVGTVGGAHLMQASTGTLHDVGDTEGAANFNQFAARHHGLASGAQGAEHQ